jgi:glycosyltransferase involved in cell wall biosynthesis
LAKVLVVNGIGDTLLSFRGPLIRELARRGHAVTVSTPAPERKDADELEREVAALGANLVLSPLARTSLNPLSERRAIRHWQELIARIQPDAVLASNPKPVFHVLPLAASASVPRRVALITGLGYAFVSSSLKARLVRTMALRLYRRALRASTAVLFQNSDDRGEFARLQLLPPNATVDTVSGSGVDLDEFRAQPLPPGPPTFLMIARLLGDKGVREFAQAARMVRARRPECRFRLVGWIDGNPSAIRREELGAWVAAGDLEWTDWRDDVRPDLAAAAVFVLPSYREGTPRSSLEALATGRAIITTDVPGCRTTVAPNHDGTTNGILVPPRDAKSLADACLQVAGDRSMMEAMGRASRALAERQFDVRLVNEAILRHLLDPTTGRTSADLP